MHCHKTIPREGVAHIIAKATPDTENDQEANRFELDIVFSHENHVFIILDLIDSTDQLVLFDISNVTYTDSAGLWFIFDLYKRVSNLGKTFLLIGVSDDIKRVMDITKLSTKIKSFNTMEDALKEFPSERTPQ